MYRGDKVILRGYEKTDLELAHRYFNDPEVQHLLNSGLILPISMAEEEKFINECANSKERGYNFAIETIEGEYLGGCGYFELDRKNRTTYVGIAIANKERWGQGYGTDAMRVLLRFLFDELDLRKVLLRVFAYNDRAIASYRRLGFVEEGRLRQQFYRRGEYHDEIIMGILRDEFVNANPAANAAPAARAPRPLRTSKVAPLRRPRA